MGDLRAGGRPREDSLPAPVPRRPLPPSTPARKPRPDPGPLRIAIGLTGMATASALVTALLGPSTGAVAGGTQITSADQAVVPASPAAVKHVTRYVQLAPGQTAPPQAVVTQPPAPKPRVVVVTTKQSGK